MPKVVMTYGTYANVNGWAHIDAYREGDDRPLAIAAYGRKPLSNYKLFDVWKTPHTLEELAALVVSVQGDCKLLLHTGQCKSVFLRLPGDTYYSKVRDCVLLDTGPAPQMWEMFLNYARLL